jgi:hypothetical protein
MTMYEEEGGEEGAGWGGEVGKGGLGSLGAGEAAGAGDLGWRQTENVLVEWRSMIVGRKRREGWRVLFIYRYIFVCVYLCKCWGSEEKGRMEKYYSHIDIYLFVSIYVNAGKESEWMKRSIS